MLLIEEINNFKKLEEKDLFLGQVIYCSPNSYHDKIIGMIIGSEIKGYNRWYRIKWFPSGNISNWPKKDLLSPPDDGIYSVRPFKVLK